MCRSPRTIHHLTSLLTALATLATALERTAPGLSGGADRLWLVLVPLSLASVVQLLDAPAE